MNDFCKCKRDSYITPLAKLETDRFGTGSNRSIRLVPYVVCLPFQLLHFLLIILNNNPIKVNRTPVAIIDGRTNDYQWSRWAALQISRLEKS